MMQQVSSQEISRECVRVLGRRVSEITKGVNTAASDGQVLAEYVVLVTAVRRRSLPVARLPAVMLVPREMLSSLVPGASDVDALEVRLNDPEIWVIVETNAKTTFGALTLGVRAKETPKSS